MLPCLLVETICLSAALYFCRKKGEKEDQKARKKEEREAKKAEKRKREQEGSEEPSEAGVHVNKKQLSLEKAAMGSKQILSFLKPKERPSMGGEVEVEVMEVEEEPSVKEGAQEDTDLRARLRVMEEAMTRGLSMHDVLDDLRLRNRSIAVVRRETRVRRPHRFETFSVEVVPKSEGMWNQPDYVCLQEKRLWNALKYLRFDGDTRPPYRGTWSKRAAAVGPRRPWGRAPRVDYEYDSEEDWEGEEDEEGESLSVTAKEDEQDKEADGLDYNDGWLAREDEPLLREDGEDVIQIMPEHEDETGKLKRVGVWFFDANFQTDRPIPDERVCATLAGMRATAVEPHTLPICMPWDAAAEEEVGAPRGGEGPAEGESASRKGAEREKKEKGIQKREVGPELKGAFLRCVEGSDLGKDRLVDHFLSQHAGPSKIQVRVSN